MIRPNGTAQDSIVGISARSSTRRAGLPPEERARFLEDAIEGLTRRRKELPCKYFYDVTGSRLFDEICDLDEYYLTRTEREIMARHAAVMAAALGPRCRRNAFGSGSSVKTRDLLDHLEDPAGYIPVDISRDHLLESAAALGRDYPGLEIRPVAADFTTPFALPRMSRPARRRIVYFPGSTIGNLHPTEVPAFLDGIVRLVGPGGGLLIGVDLKKDPAILHRAYNDAQGVTAAFNLNLLARMNRELGADFELDQFRHEARYNESKGRIEMHLVSLADQEVTVGDTTISFQQGETILTEFSYKYDLEQFRGVAAASGLEVVRVWTDERRAFSVQYLKVG
jgi:dimethylhistidine N-methyltransferase